LCKQIIFGWLGAWQCIYSLNEYVAMSKLLHIESFLFETTFNN
jgi:hypothetical protein